MSKLGQSHGGVCFEKVEFALKYLKSVSVVNVVNVVNVIMVVLSLAALGCTEPNLGYVSDPSLPGECRSGHPVSETFDQFEQSNLLDILFVLDASGDSEVFIDSIQEAIPGFLEKFEEAEIKVRFGVTTTDAKAAIRAGESDLCKTRIVDSETTKDWKTIAACNAGQRVSDDFADEPLAVTNRLLDDKLWRKRAKRLVVILTRDDDCSGGNITDAQPREACVKAQKHEIEIFEKAFRASVNTPEGFTLAVLAGPSSSTMSLRPVCNATLGAVYAANRLYSLTEAFGEQGFFASLCTNDLVSPLRTLADQVIQQGVTLCSSQVMTHEPLRVVDGDDNLVSVGKDGFIYAADQGQCKNSALVFDHSGSSAIEKVKVEYCAP